MSIFHTPVVLDPACCTDGCTCMHWYDRHMMIYQWRLRRKHVLISCILATPPTPPPQPHTHTPPGTSPLPPSQCCPAASASPRSCWLQICLTNGHMNASKRLADKMRLYLIMAQLHRLAQHGDARTAQGRRQQHAADGLHCTCSTGRWLIMQSEQALSSIRMGLPRACRQGKPCLHRNEAGRRLQIGV